MITLDFLAYAIAIFSLSGLFSYWVLRLILPRLMEKGICGIDMHKPGKPKVAEMGGIGVVAGFSIGVLCAIFFNTFLGFDFNIGFVLAALACIFMLAFIGFVDDLLDIPQSVKAFLPLLAAIPLIAAKSAGSTAMHLPFVGVVDFGIIYFFIFIPIGIAVASNLTNMLAGFNGMEAGMGIVVLIAASFIAISANSPEALVIYIPMIGALLGLFLLNKHPAKIFPGDTAALIIGASLAAGSIIGNFESIAAILLLPHVIDFFIKAANRFPKTWGEYRDGKLYAPEGKVRGLVHLVMVKANGITEGNLVLLFIIMEENVAIAVLVFFLHIKIL